eukprot:Phypoly_transcript_03103.p1 GENE.Phypoly_transcript_03103~~Phypoly_transcript_03103.p1  ORF type:complete len:802 (+),score=125.25 Phypoly_transcript_03103:78-2483(+)
MATNNTNESSAEEQPLHENPSGPMNMAEIDCPHSAVAIEWWYVNGHLHIDGDDSSSPPFSFFAAFFRFRRNPRRVPGSAFSWAIVDTRGEGEYYTDSVLDSICTGGLELALQSEKNEMDKAIADELLAVLKRGKMPGPERAIQTPANASKIPPLSLDFGPDGRFTRDDVTGNYKLACEHPEKHMMLDLELTPQRKPAQHSRDGITKVNISKLGINGKLSVPSKAIRGEKQTFSVHGSGWYEHGFGGDARELAAQGPKYKHLGHWFSLQLSNNSEISALHLVNPETKETVENLAHIFSDSEPLECKDLIVQDVSDKVRWMSMHTSLTYSTKWKLTIPSAKVDLLVVPSSDDQEYVSFIKNPALWEGRMHVTGTVDGTPVTGYGFLEMNAVVQAPAIREFFSNFTVEIMRQAAELLPLNPTLDQICALAGNAPFARQFLATIDPETVVETIIRPLREIIDRGKKCWRSCAGLLFIDCVGGNSNKYRKILAGIEVVQAGVLIIDDVEDRSELRRGGPACHKMFGDAIAINAGTAAYFIGTNLIDLTTQLSPAAQLEGFYSYFSGVALSHMGQGSDIRGFGHLLPEAIETGDNTRLITSIKNCYTLKTASMFSICAKIGAEQGGATKAQTDAIFKYLSIALVGGQIYDDVFNLRGFDKETKIRGEDITEGKITYPVAVAMSSAIVPSKEARQSIIDRLKTKPNPHFYKKKMLELEQEIASNSGEDLTKLQEEFETNKRLFQEQEATLNGLIDDLEKYGAIEEAKQSAKRLAEEHWPELDAVLTDSRQKMLLKAFPKLFFTKDVYF